ncbi:hypothetical protein [Acidicapsa ligni]|uniref:hypothetical protein n=1 Tax=Acidicapsa ligni TaxID=542300 RepID=UPI0021DFAD19|nr:hypothetical protein [Acidicapsa ligni]
MDPTHNLTEVNANHVQFNIMNSMANKEVGPNGSFTLNIGTVHWDKGQTFKAITPDIQQMVRQQNGSWTDKPAFPGSEG